MRQCIEARQGCPFLDYGRQPFHVKRPEKSTVKISKQQVTFEDSGKHCTGEAFFNYLFGSFECSPLRTEMYVFQQFFATIPYFTKWRFSNIVVWPANSFSHRIQAA